MRVTSEKRDGDFMGLAVPRGCSQVHRTCAQEAMWCSGRETEAQRSHGWGRGRGCEEGVAQWMSGGSSVPFVGLTPGPEGTVHKEGVAGRGPQGSLGMDERSSPASGSSQPSLGLRFFTGQ